MASLLGSKSFFSTEKPYLFAYNVLILRITISPPCCGYLRLKPPYSGLSGCFTCETTYSSLSINCSELEQLNSIDVVLVTPSNSSKQAVASGRHRFTLWTILWCPGLISYNK